MPKRFNKSKSRKSTQKRSKLVTKSKRYKNKSKRYKNKSKRYKKQQETQRPVYVPTAQTLKKLTDRFSNHPQRAIMETPYTSTVLKGFRKTNFTGKLYANKYLHADEVEMYVKD